MAYLGHNKMSLSQRCPCFRGVLYEGLCGTHCQRLCPAVAPPCIVLGTEDENCTYFLETERGEPYIEVFRAIRIQHILNDIVSVQTLESDKIVPKSERTAMLLWYWYT